MIKYIYGGAEKSWDGFMDRFPILFADRKKPMTETCMCWGIECPIGWYYILDQLCTILEFNNMEFVRNYNLAIVADQVKEKYGTLRFYYSVCNVDDVGKKICDVEKDSHGRLMCTVSNKKTEREEKIASDYLVMLADKYISEAERMTENTCADCGRRLDDDNKVVTKGWITYLCKGCHNKREKEREKSLTQGD